ncbi:MAG: PfkB family carbohydrate kinase [Clostridiales bacterium]|nr:PfkB family carbohydrate kinase [Clostridiales bacterium]
MNGYSSIIIGHITMDRNVDYQDNEVYIPGGAVVYSSASAYALGHNVLAVTKVAERDSERLNAMTLPKENVRVIYCDKSTDMYNRYLTADKERRICVCTSRGTPFTVEDIPTDANAEIYHFAGLIYGDFPNEMVKEAAKRGKVAFDVQTCLRHVSSDGSGSMYFEDWKDKAEMLPYIDFLKTDAAEAEIMTGLEDRYEAARLLHSWGAKEVVITHNTEVIAYDGNRMCACPIRARNLSGRTGRGDTTFAAYINERLTNDMESSLLTATATVSLKMETPGPFKGTREDIEKYISDFYSDIK